jgi:3'-5' exoribonuclease
MRTVLNLKDINYSQQEAIEFEASILGIEAEGEEEKKRPLRFTIKLESSGDVAQVISWNYSILEIIKEAAKGTEVLNLEGLAGTFKDNQQIRVGNVKMTGKQSVRKIIKTINISEVKREINSIINKYITTRNIRDMLDAMVMSNPNFFEWPAATKIHHNYEGGLAVHTLQVARHSVAMWESYEGKNLDIEVIVTGALLHDYGKLTEYNKDGSRTIYGQLIGHPVDGAEKMVEYCIRNNIDANRDRKLVMVKHIILSHHEKMDFGAPVVPSILEALIVARADALDGSFEGVSKEIENLSAGEFTDRLLAVNGSKFLKWM